MTKGNGVSTSIQHLLFCTIEIYFAVLRMPKKSNSKQAHIMPALII